MDRAINQLQKLIFDFDSINIDQMQKNQYWFQSIDGWSIVVDGIIYLPSINQLIDISIIVDRGMKILCFE